MPIDYEASAALLCEIWGALRMPVAPWKSASTYKAMRECFARACRCGENHFPTCVESILFRAAGDIEFAPEARAELAAMFRGASRPALRQTYGQGQAITLPKLSLAGIAAICVKLEMLAFDIDSRPILEVAQSELDRRCKTGKMAMPREFDAKWIEARFKSRVIMRSRHRREHQKVRTLRTHRGFIIQAYLRRNLEPVRLDVFGPKYSRVSDWMDLPGADMAWSIELRDAPGYDAGAKLQRIHPRAEPRPA